MTPSTPAPVPGSPPMTPSHPAPLPAGPATTPGRPARLMTAAAVTLGLVTVGWPLAWAPAWTYAIASLGSVAVLAAVFLRWRRGPVLAVAAAIISCAVSHVGIPVLAAEGLFILAYLLLADAPQGMADPVRWLRRQVVLFVAGLITAGAVLAVYAVHQPDSAWLTFAGLAAAVVAYLLALPRLRQGSGVSAARRRKSGT